VGSSARGRHQGEFLAAHRAGIKRVILPERNRKDIIEIPDQPKKEIEILFRQAHGRAAALVLTEMPKLGAMTAPAMTPSSVTPTAGGVRTPPRAPTDAGPRD